MTNIRSEGLAGSRLAVRSHSVKIVTWSWFGTCMLQVSFRFSYISIRGNGHVGRSARIVLPAIGSDGCENAKKKRFKPKTSGTYVVPHRC